MLENPNYLYWYPLNYYYGHPFVFYFNMDAKWMHPHPFSIFFSIQLHIHIGKNMEYVTSFVYVKKKDMINVSLQLIINDVHYIKTSYMINDLTILILLLLIELRLLGHLLVVTNKA